MKKPAIHCASLTLPKSMSGGFIWTRVRHLQRRLNTTFPSGKSFLPYDFSFAEVSVE